MKHFLIAFCFCSFEIVQDIQGTSSERKEDPAGARRHPPFACYRLACEAATRGGLGVEEYLSNVLRFQNEFIKSKEIVDRDGFLEALALPGLPVTNSESESQLSTLAQRALQYFVMITKETGVASVVLFSSELGYPYRLQACGMNLQDPKSSSQTKCLKRIC